MSYRLKLNDCVYSYHAGVQMPVFDAWDRTNLLEPFETLWVK